MVVYLESTAKRLLEESASTTDDADMSMKDFTSADDTAVGEEPRVVEAAYFVSQNSLPLWLTHR